MVTRRAFLRTLAATGGVLVLSALAQACAPIVPTATTTGLAEAPQDTATPRPTEVPATAAPTSAPTTASPTAQPTEPATVAPSLTTAPATSTPRPPAKGRVALIKTTDRAEGVRRAIALLGVGPMPEASVFLKPNYNSADPSPGSTHPDVLRAMVEQLYNLGAGSITVGDRSGMGDTRTVMQQLGVFRQAEELGFDTLVFDELPPEAWAHIDEPDDHWSQGFYLPRAVLEAESLVQTCNLKTHRFGGHFTLALKNSVGLVARRVGGGHDYMSELHSSPHQRTMIAEVNRARQPALIVMDGVQAFTHGGPDRGTVVDAGVVLAATDLVAIDAVGVAILRLFGTTPEVSQGAVFEQAQIARAVELGLGVSEAAEIELVTEDDAGAAMADEIIPLLS